MKALLVGTLLMLAGLGFAQDLLQTGYAVYYGGKKDSSTTYTAAHLSLPLGTWVEVRHQKTGKTVRVKINDRGPFGNKNRIIDLSTDAARELGILSEGVALVEIKVLDR